MNRQFLLDWCPLCTSNKLWWITTFRNFNRHYILIVLRLRVLEQFFGRYHFTVTRCITRPTWNHSITEKKTSIKSRFQTSQHQESYHQLQISDQVIICWLRNWHNRLKQHLSRALNAHCNTIPNVPLWRCRARNTSHRPITDVQKLSSTKTTSMIKTNNAPW